MFEFIFALVGFAIAMFSLYQLIATARCTKKVLRELEITGYNVDKKAYSIANYTMLIHTVIVIAAFVIVYYFFVENILWFTIGFGIGFLVVIGKTGLTNNNINDIVKANARFITAPEQNNSCE